MTRLRCSARAWSAQNIVGSVREGTLAFSHVDQPAPRQKNCASQRTAMGGHFDAVAVAVPLHFVSKRNTSVRRTQFTE